MTREIRENFSLTTGVLDAGDTDVGSSFHPATLRPPSHDSIEKDVRSAGTPHYVAVAMSCEGGPKYKKGHKMERAS